MSGAQTVNVTYSGEIDFTQLNNTGTFFYQPASTFNSTNVQGPTTSDIIAISGTTDTHTFTFSSPVVNPVMAIVSLGQPGDPVSYNFNANFTILSQGPSTAFGGCDTCLSGSGTNVLTGTEGDGVIQFTGTFSTLSFTVTNSEFWNGFTIGVAGTGTATPEPASYLTTISGLGLVALAFGLKLRRKALN